MGTVKIDFTNHYYELIKINSKIFLLIVKFIGIPKSGMIFIFMFVSTDSRRKAHGARLRIQVPTGTSQLVPSYPTLPDPFPPLLKHIPYHPSTSVTVS